MAADAHRPSITPALVLCLGDFGEQVAQALVPEIRAAGPAVEAAVCWLRVTWPATGRVRLTGNAGQTLLEMGEEDAELWTALRGKMEEALRGIGLHATRERLLRAGYGLPDDVPAGRQARCYLVAALREAPVVAALTPLLAQVNALHPQRVGSQPWVAFLNIATHSLDPDAPQRATISAALDMVPDLPAGPPRPCWQTCVLLDWIKTGNIYAEGDDELGAALVALLRVLLLADEPAALLQEAFPRTSWIDGRSPVFCSLGVAVIQSPPREAILDWLAARLMAEFLSRRCLDPLEGPQEITLGHSQPVASYPQLRAILEALAEGLNAEVTAEPNLRVSTSPGRPGRRLDVTDATIAKAGQLLIEQVERNRSALERRLLSESDPVGRLPNALAAEINRGPHGLWGAEALLKATAEQIHRDRAVLTDRLARWPLNHERLAEQAHQAQAVLNALRGSLPSPRALLLKSALVATLWGYLFGTRAGRLWGASEVAGAMLTALLVFIGTGLWYVCYKKRWQLRRAKQNHVAAAVALQTACVETAVLEAAQAVLSASDAWLERQAERLRDARMLLQNVQTALAVRPLALPSDPVIVETLPYLDAYANWLRTVLQDDPLMLEVQATLERGQALANWPDLDEAALPQAFIEAGRQALRNVPEFSVEDVLTSQDRETLAFHLERLHGLATPLIALNRPAIVSQSGEPGTLDIACLEQGAVARLGPWLEHHLPDSASIAVTGDLQRVTYIRLLSGFDLGNLRNGSLISGQVSRIGVNSLAKSKRPDRVVR